MTYKPENSLNIGAEEYGILCAQDHLAGSLANLLEGMIEDSGWTRPITEHPMWHFIAATRERKQRLSDVRHNEAERMQEYLASR